MPTTPVTDWGTAIITSVSAALGMFLGAIPRIIGFLVILIIGWIISGLLAGAVASLLRAVKFNDLAERSGFAGFVRQMGVRTDAAGVLATVAKWFVRLIVLVVAFDALGLPAVSQVLQQLLLWLPNLVVALVILVIAGLAANALHGLVRGATAQAGFGSPDLLANIARAAVWGFAIVVAVNQIGVAQTLVNTLFMAIVGALALALALAFGLGGRETAQQIVSNWYRRGQQGAPKMARAAEAAREQVQPPRSSRSAPAARYADGTPVGREVPPGAARGE
jgi:Conserved TM helix